MCNKAKQYTETPPLAHGAVGGGAPVVAIDDDDVPPEFAMDDIDEGVDNGLANDADDPNGVERSGEKDPVDNTKDRSLAKQLVSP